MSGELKRRAAERAGADLELYVAAKAALVAELLARARADHGLPVVEYWEPDVMPLEPRASDGRST